MKSRTHVLLFLVVMSSNVFAGGLIGDLVEKACGNCGLGTKLDEKHDELKEAVPAYGKAEETVSKGVRDGAKEANEVVDKGAREAGNAGRDINRAAIKGGKEVQNLAKDVDTWIRTGDCGGDICDTLAKAVDDTIDESDRAADNIEDAGQAIGKYVERQVHSAGDTLSDAAERIREGKVVDALWHLGTDPLRHTSDNAAAAAEESKILATVGQIAATAYGGPQGAAAYAAWLTYSQTCNQGKCDPELALRVGMITGATSWAMGQAGKMPSDTAAQLAKKAAVSGAVGGLAVAVSGGDESAIKKGFALSAGAVLIRDGYKRVTDADLDARASKDDAYCMSTTDVEMGCAPKAAYKRNPDGSIGYKKNPDGSYALNKNGAKVPIIEDIRRLDPRRPHVGNWGDGTRTKWTDVNYETAPVMEGISKIPAMNAMSVFHDQWSFSVNMDPVTNVVTIVPAAVLTYIGTGAPAYDLIQKSNLKQKSSLTTSPSQKSNNSPSKIDESAVALTLAALDAGAQQEVSISSGSVAASMLCINGDKARQIVVDAPSYSPGYACRVIYQNEHGITVPWYAYNDNNYCRPKAVALTVKQMALGWSCYVR